VENEKKRGINTEQSDAKKKYLSRKALSMKTDATKLSSITQNLDRIVAIGAATVALVVILVMAFLQPTTWYRYLEAPVLLLIAAIVYLVVRRRLSRSEISFPSELSAGSSVHLILNILFFGLFFYSILSVYLSPELYIRPLGYFISTAMATAVLAVEILFLPKGRASTGFILLKMALIVLSLRFVAQLIFPELLGHDPWMHRVITSDMLASGYIPEGQAYSKLPVLHLATGSTMLITNLDYKLSAMLSVGFFQVASLVFVFLLGRLVQGPKVGLLAALLLGIASTGVELGFWIRPITVGVILTPVLIYTAFKAKEERSVVLVTLTLLFSAVLILTHTVAAMSMALFLFLFWFGFEIYKAVYRERSEIPIGFALSCLFTIAMLSWWMYESGTLMTIAQLIARGLRVELWEHLPIVSQYVTEQARLEFMLNMLGFTLYLALSTIGLFYMWSKRFVNKYLFTLALGAWGLMGLLFLLPLIGRTGILAGRWYGSLEFITAIPLAIGLLWLCEPWKNRLGKACAMGVLVLILCFMAITRPNANIDNPIYSPNTMSRYAFFESELKAANTIPGIYQGPILTDYASPFPESAIVNPKEAGFGSHLVSGDYTGIEGLVVIRKEVVEGVHNIKGPYKLDHDPREELINLNFNRVYNSGTVAAFFKEIEVKEGEVAQ